MPAAGITVFENGMRSSGGETLPETQSKTVSHRQSREQRVHQFVPLSSIHLGGVRFRSGRAAQMVRYGRSNIVSNQKAEPVFCRLSFLLDLVL